MDEQNNYNGGNQYDAQYQNNDVYSQYNNGQQYQNDGYSQQYNGQQYQNDPYAQQQYNGQQQFYQQPQQQYYQQEITDAQLPPKYKPVKAWGYFLYNILFAIPIVGLIINLVFCFSNENINRRNYARSMWCSLLIVTVLAIIIGIIMAIAGLSLSDALGGGRVSYNYF